VKFHRIFRLVSGLAIAHTLVLSLIIALYFSQYFFPAEEYKQQVKISATYKFLTSDVTLRAPGGWGSDKATECLSLGMGLNSSGSLGDLLLNYHPNQNNTYNPCSGLIGWSNDDSSSYQFQTYARYWHGHSEVIRWLVYLFGIPISRSILALTIGIALIILWKRTTITLSDSIKNPSLTTTLLLGSYAFLVGLIDLPLSMTHLLSETFVVVIAILSLSILQTTNRYKIAFSGYLIGGIYVVICYMINPQSIPPAVLIWSVIPIVLSKTKKISEVLKNYCILISSIVIGFIGLWITKWVLISLLTDYDIWEEVRNQALHRASHNPDSLSPGVAQHLDTFSSLPAFAQAILANCAALVSKVFDPRFSNPILGYFMLMFLLVICVKFLWDRRRIYISKTSKSQNGQFKEVTLLWLMSLAGVLIWYAFLTQHSFDHATYTFRSLAIVVSGFIWVISAQNREMTRVK
jgi:hypothetical protein